MEQGPLNIIGARVRELREKAGLTQEQLMARCQVLGLDITRTALAKIESLRRTVGDYELLALAKALRVSTDTLFPRTAPNVTRRLRNPKGTSGKKKSQRSVGSGRAAESAQKPNSKQNS